MKANISLMTLTQAESAFNILLANQARLFLTLNLIVIQNRGNAVSKDDVAKFMEHFQRKTDIFFVISENSWGIILTQGQKNEALAFLNRLFSQPVFTKNNLDFVACSFEIRNDQTPFEKSLRLVCKNLKITNN